MENKGLILPVGSPLIQFEVEHPAHGSHVGYIRIGQKFPYITWVDRNGFMSSWCESFAFIDYGKTGEMITMSAEGKRNGAVCLCMGRFIE